MPKWIGLFALAAIVLAVPCGVARATPTETILHHFHGAADGAVPEGDLVAGPDGSLYGTTYRGGASNFGTVYRLSPPATGKSVWTMTVLHTFGGGIDGANPLVGLARNAAGELFGTTTAGGTNGHGVVFRLTPPAPGKTAWTETILHRFLDPARGSVPQGIPVFDTQGVLYGTTSQGGTQGAGIVYSLTPPAPGKTAWPFRVLVSLSPAKEGFGPGTLLRSSDGKLYGVTALAAAANHGAVFMVAPPEPGKTAWTSTVLYAFAGSPDGETALGALIANANGVLFGTTEYGGTNNKGTVFRLAPPAPGKTVWTETILHRFVGGTNGANPYTSLIVGPGGALIGTTDDLTGGYHGTIFRLNPPASGMTTWTKTILHHFQGAPDGADPYGAPLIRNGILYGTTGAGGTFGHGTIWRITP